MVRPSKWPPEFRERAVALYRESEGRTIAEVALELGVGAETFRKWVRQDEADRGERSDRPLVFRIFAGGVARVRRSWRRAGDGQVRDLGV